MTDENLTTNSLETRQMEWVEKLKRMPKDQQLLRLYALAIIIKNIRREELEKERRSRVSLREYNEISPIETSVIRLILTHFEDRNKYPIILKNEQPSGPGVEIRKKTSCIVTNIFSINALHMNVDDFYQLYANSIKDTRIEQIIGELSTDEIRGFPLSLELVQKIIEISPEDEKTS